MRMRMSKLIPNLRNKWVRRALANPYEMHRDLMSAFPDAGVNEARQAYGVLYRVDASLDPRTDVRMPIVLVQSSIEPVPDWTKLRLDGHGGAWLADPPISKTVEIQFSAGQCLQFRLRANPVKRAGNSHRDAKWIGKRVPLVENDGQSQWLARQGMNHGFKLLQVTPRPDRAEAVFDVAERPEGCVVAVKEKQSITHYAVVFEGLLQVTDSDLFVRAIGSGIGPAKAFGFGLLSLARPR